MVIMFRSIRSPCRSTYHAFPVRILWSVEKPVGTQYVASVVRQRPAHELLSALRNGSIRYSATAFDAAPIGRGHRVTIDGSSGLPSIKADGQVTHEQLEMTLR